MRAVISRGTVVDVLRGGVYLPWSLTWRSPTNWCEYGPLGNRLDSECSSNWARGIARCCRFPSLGKSVQLAGDPGITATAAVAKHGARHVCAVSRVPVRGGAVTDHVGVGQHACTEIAVIRVQSGIGHGHDDPEPLSEVVKPLATLLTRMCCRA